MIKEEKENTEMRAEELESRVNHIHLDDDRRITNVNANSHLLSSSYLNRHHNRLAALDSPVDDSGRSTPQADHLKSDLLKLTLTKSIRDPHHSHSSSKSSTAPPGMSAKFMQIFGDEFISNTSDPIAMNNEIKEYNERYRKQQQQQQQLYESPDSIIEENKYESMRRNLLTAAFQNNNNNNNNNNTSSDANLLDSPLNSKTSSSDSLNYLLMRKDSFLDAQQGLNMGSQSSNVNGSGSLDYSMNNFAKKKSLKTTLYRMFTQRKKVQKLRSLQGSGGGGGGSGGGGVGSGSGGDVSYSNPDSNFYSDLSRNQLTIKTDKNVKKK